MEFLFVEFVKKGRLEKKVYYGFELVWIGFYFYLFLYLFFSMYIIVSCVCIFITIIIKADYGLVSLHFG